MFPLLVGLKIVIQSTTEKTKRRLGRRSIYFRERRRIHVDPPVIVQRYLEKT